MPMSPPFKHKKNNIYRHFKCADYVTDCVPDANGSVSHKCNVKSVDAQ